jgi:hypothetical protein
MVAILEASPVPRQAVRRRLRDHQVMPGRVIYGASCGFRIRLCK